MDHYCWMRPENMTTLRTPYSVDASHPGSDLVGEVVAAMAASAIVFRDVTDYSERLVKHATELFDFAATYRGLYSESMPAAKGYYSSSSGFEDELLWASVWMFRATGNSSYLEFAVGANSSSLGGQTVSMQEFSWDNKYAGLQILITILRFQNFSGMEWKSYESTLNLYRDRAEEYVCAHVEMTVPHTPEGLVFIREWLPLQYSVNAAFLVGLYGDYLAQFNGKLTCGGSRMYTWESLYAFSESQVRYILGGNKASRSYLVGHGSLSPSHLHHRGASIPSDGTSYDCTEGYRWLFSDSPDPNLLEGAVVGGPDQWDGFQDKRTNFSQSEPTTYTNAVFSGIVARLTFGPQVYPPGHVLPTLKGVYPLEIFGFVGQSWFEGDLPGIEFQDVTVRVVNGDLERSVASISINCGEFDAGYYWGIRRTGGGFCELLAWQFPIGPGSSRNFSYIEKREKPAAFSIEGFEFEEGG